MQRISRSQRKTLKKIKKKPITVVPEVIPSKIQFLKNNDYLEYEGINQKEGFLNKEVFHITSIKISEKGIAYLYTSRIDSIKWSIPIIISIVSLAKSYGFGIENFITWCMKLLVQLWK